MDFKIMLCSSLAKVMPQEEPVALKRKTFSVLKGEKFSFQLASFGKANWFSHQLARHITNNDLRREISVTRSVEKQQQLKISLLKPDDFCEIDNLDYDTIVPAYQKLVSVNPDVVVRANLDMLNILSAYDICKKKEFLIFF